MLIPAQTILLVIDVQGKLAEQMHGKEKLFANLKRLVEGTKALGIPILWNEQYPKGLGPTIPILADMLKETTKPIEKNTFSAVGAAPFREALSGCGRRQVLVCGIETHVCVYQTVVDLLPLGYEVQVVTDAVSSRTKENKDIGLMRMRDAGALWTSTEMALFELVRIAEGPAFKTILSIIK